MSAFFTWLLSAILGFIVSKLESWGVAWWDLQQAEQGAQDDADKDEKAIEGAQTDADRANAAASSAGDAFKQL